MKHFSHPHSLILSESPNKEEEEEEEEIMCSGCIQPVSSPDAAYICTKRECDFVLHKWCFELPMETEHKSHPNHLLTLLSEPPRFKFYYDCNACEGLINSFSYNCEECDNFRLHVNCAFLPESVECKAHSHALELQYYAPEAGHYYCNVCDGSMREGYWSYFCKECDFGTHLACAFSAEAVSEKEQENEESEEEECEVENENEDKEEKNEDEEEEVENEEEVGEEKENEEDNEDDGLSEQRKLQIATLRAMDQMAITNFQLQMAEMNARMIRRF